LKFRDAALFKENIGLLREKNGGAEMVSSGTHLRKEIEINLILAVSCAFQILIEDICGKMSKRRLHRNRSAIFGAEFRIGFDVWMIAFILKALVS
jgi:hypothetical protein